MSKIQTTKNYALFTRAENNRETNVKKRRGLMKSMKQYGFLKCFPIVVRRINGKLVVKDGQHRLAMAESLGLPVHWIEVEDDFDIAVINSSGEKWATKDYAHTYAKLGNKHYQEGLEFCGRHHIAIGIGFSILAGTTTFTNIKEDFISGEFVVKDRKWAESVAAIYAPMVKLSEHLHNARFLLACMSVCRVPELDQKRLLSGAERCREKLVSYSTREAYLDMMEEIYNFGRSKLFGLKSAALMAMRDRSFALNPKGHKARVGRQKGAESVKKTAVAGH